MTDEQDKPRFCALPLERLVRCVRTRCCAIIAYIPLLILDCGIFLSASKTKKHTFGRAREISNEFTKMLWNKYI